MSRNPSGKSRRDVELVEDAWPRFEQFVTKLAKAKPQHRLSGKAKAKKKLSSGDHKRRADN